MKLPPYVHGYLDRHGKARHYFRRRGFKKVPLPGMPWSPEFMAAYQAALAGVTATTTQIGANRTKPGTLNAAVVGYYQSIDFQELSAGTKASRRAILERLRSKTGTDGIAGGDRPLALLDQKNVLRLLSQLKPHARRNWLKTLRGLLEFAKAEGFIAANPTDGLKTKVPSSEGHYMWSEHDIAQYEARHPIGTKARLAFGLLLYTAQRRGDVIRMGRQHIRDGYLHIVQEKTGTPLQLPVRPELQAILDATPSNHLTFLVTKSGGPYSGTDFSEYFRTQCDAAGLPKKCTAHWLRKAAARRLAESGASTHQIAAWTGHKTLAEVQRYTKAADQARLAREAIEHKPNAAVANLLRKSD
jgi:integrase